VPPSRRRALALAAAAGLALAVLPLAAGPAGADDATGPIGGQLMGAPGVVVAPGVHPPPDVAASWLVADMDSGLIYGAKAPHTLLRPASTLKTLTALVLLPLLKPATVYTATLADTQMQGTRVGMVAGATYTVDELFRAMLLPSANDATHALETIAGGTGRTVALMAAEARHLQADDTTIKDPSGLDQRGQFSSAYDLALFGRAAMAMPAFCAYVVVPRSTFPGRMPKKPGAARASFAIQSLNRLLLEGYPGIIGVKTGYTSQAGNTFIGAATRSGHTLLVVLMHTKGNADVAERRLLNWAFDNYGRAAPVGELVGPAAPVSESASAATLSQVRPPAAAGTPAGSSASLLGWLAAVAAAGALAVAGGAVVRSSRRRRRRGSPLGLAPLRRR